MSQRPDSPDYSLTRNAAPLLPPTVRCVRVLIDFLRWRFSKLPAGAFHWNPETADTPDQTGSEIYIAADTPLPGKHIGHRPAISVMRSQAAFQGIGIGDLAFHDLASGAKSHMDLIPTTMVINVISRLPIVAERLAFFIQDQIFALREVIVRSDPCILATGARTNIGAPSPAGALVEAADYDGSVVPLYLPTYLQHATHTMPMNRPILNKVRTVVKGG